MRVIFVRHSEPDYSMLDGCEHPENYSGFGRDLAPLSEHGRHLARELAKSESFQSADVIISSSITRALETATYIARETGLDLLVEPFFHEWRPDLEHLNYTAEPIRLFGKMMASYQKMRLIGMKRQNRLNNVF